MYQISRFLIALIRYDLFGVPLSVPESFSLTEETLEKLYRLATKHDLAHLAGDALYKNKLLPKDSSAAAKFQKAQVTALYRYTQLEHEYKQISRVLQKTEIPYIPLKGIVIRPFYPQPYLRTSCDIDVLIPEKDLEKAIAQLTDELHYTWDGTIQYHDVSLFSPNGFHLELHFSINETHETMDRLLSQVWENSSPLEEGSYEYRQSPEFFMFHQVAHMAYHFLGGGCGIRPLIDLYILRQKMLFDENILQAFCAQCKLDDFYNYAKLLCDVWFGNASHSDLTLQMENYILHGGVYGNLENSITVKRGADQSAFAYIMSRLFVPYKSLKIRYPVLVKHKWLYPFMTVRRWVETLSPAKRRRASAELKQNRYIKKGDQDNMQVFLSQLGLS